MVNAISRRRTRALVLIAVLSIVVFAMTAYSATVYISAQKGGTVYIAPGMELVIAPKALEADTMISADMVRKRDRICYRFGPDETTFDKPAKLKVSLMVIDDVDDLTLYGEDGEEIKPQIRGGCAVYNIAHFSLYYFRRR